MAVQRMTFCEKGSFGKDDGLSHKVGMNPFYVLVDTHTISYSHTNANTHTHSYKDEHPNAHRNTNSFTTPCRISYIQTGDSQFYPFTNPYSIGIADKSRKRISTDYSQRLHPLPSNRSYTFNSFFCAARQVKWVWALAAALSARRCARLRS